MKASTTWEEWSCHVRLTVSRPAALASARAHLVGLMADVELSASRFTPSSDISRINAAAGRMVHVSGRTIALVDIALDAAAETEGLVDPTVGAHVLRAGYTADITQVRDQLLVTAAGDELPPADWSQVRIDHQRGRVGVPAGIRLDLGATAKAWTADVAAHAIAATYGTGVLVEIGGDLAVAGTAESPWQVQVSERAGGEGERVGLTSGGLATSSSAARAWRTPQGAAHHIIDPRTGEPAVSIWRSATVWARSAVEANTASTAAIVLGDEAAAYLTEMQLPARLVDHHGRVVTLGAWPHASRAA